MEPAEGLIERLAIPAQGAEGATLEAWAERLGAAVRRDGPDAAWLEVGGLRLRGFATFEGVHVEAIDFEMRHPDALAHLQAAAASLGWELHDDGEDED